MQWTGTVLESDHRFMTAAFEPVVAPDAGPAHVLAAWYKPTSSGERPYVHQPIGYPELPAQVVARLSALCDHCGHQVRGQTFFVFRVRDTGGWTHVSVGCLGDYLGDDVRAGEIIAWAAKYDRFVATIRDAMPEQGREHFSPEEVIETALKVISVRGWVSRGDAKQTGKRATAELVLDLLEHSANLDPPPAVAALAMEINADPNRDDIGKWGTVRDILSWLRGLHAEEVAAGREHLLTDYLHNLATVASMDYVEARSVGLLCSAPGAYDAWQKQKAAERASVRAPVDAGKFFGAIGDRVEADVYVDEVEDRGENEYGRSLLVHLHVMPTGEKLSWWTGEGLKLDEHKQYHVRMTVVKHAPWDGYNITTVNRVMEYNGPTPRKKKDVGGAA